MKRTAVSLAASSTKMQELAAPGKKVEEKQGKFLGKLVRIATDRSFLCGYLMEVKSHAGTKLMGGNLCTRIISKTSSQELTNLLTI